MDLTTTVAMRLRQLRIAKGLSHQKLSDSIKEETGVYICPDSLVKYEVTTEDHRNNGKNLGMRLEYLYAIASYYNVSADYILGTTDTRSRSTEVQTACEVTGLSEESIEKLKRCKEESDSALIYDMVNDFISFAFDDSDPYKGQPFVKYISFRECAAIYLEKANVLLNSVNPVGLYSEMENEMEYLMANSNFFPLPYHEAAALLRTVFCDEFKRYLDERYPLEVAKNGND